MRRRLTVDPLDPMQRSVSGKTRTKKKKSIQRSNKYNPQLGIILGDTRPLDGQQREMNWRYINANTAQFWTYLSSPQLSRITLRCVWSVARTNPTPITAIFWRACGAISLRRLESFFTLTKQSTITLIISNRALIEMRHITYILS